MVSELVAVLGKGNLMAKLDIKSAYRKVPVHHEDRPLLGMEWLGELCMDACLPFGLWSAPRIFTALADALEWGVKQQGVSHLLHYLDDYITLGAPESQECTANMSTFLEWCKQLGVPIAAKKCEGPSTRLTYLDIEIDTESIKLHLPEEKLQMGENGDAGVAWPQSGNKNRTRVVGGLTSTRSQGCTPWVKVCKADHCADDISLRSGPLCKIKC